MDLANLRREYQLKGLSRNDLDPSPFEQFRKWFSDVLEAQIIESNAMSLATATKEGKPSCRMVLLKHFDETGLHFFTNYESRKGRELEQNPFAAANFFWKELERQVVVEGQVKKLSKEESLAYFSKRPRASRIGAWASHQGSPLASRQDLDNEYQRLEKFYKDQDIPLPSYWGGLRIIPNRFEFWQGRESRLSDRFAYTLENETWKIQRISP